MRDPVTWYVINYARTQIMKWDFQNKGVHSFQSSLAFLFLKVPLHYLECVPAYM